MNIFHLYYHIQKSCYNICSRFFILINPKTEEFCFIDAKELLVLSLNATLGFLQKSLKVQIFLKKSEIQKDQFKFFDTTAPAAATDTAEQC